MVKRSLYLHSVPPTVYVYFEAFRKILNNGFSHRDNHVSQRLPLKTTRRQLVIHADINLS